MTSSLNSSEERILRQETVTFDPNVSRKQEVGQVMLYRDVNLFCAAYNIRHKYNMLTFEPIWKYLQGLSIGHLYARSKAFWGHTHDDIHFIFCIRSDLQRLYQCVLNRLSESFPRRACKR